MDKYAGIDDATVSSAMAVLFVLLLPFATRRALL
jgi:hypothetical protein